MNAPGNSTGSGFNPGDTTSGYRYLGNNPTAFNNATSAAVPSANDVKRTGARVFAIGVGSAVNNSASEDRLKEVSGPDAGTNPITADHILVPDFARLREELGRVVASLCGSSLTIIKKVSDSRGGPWTLAPDWRFTATLTSPGHAWLKPATAGTGDRATETTGSNGEAEFLWRLSHDTTAHLGITKETVKPGFRFVLAECETHNLDGKLLHRTVVDSLPIPGTTLGREEFRTCEVYNAADRPGGGGGDETDVVKPADAPRLTIQKTMPAHARVGHRVRITITVKNVGHETAKDVRLHETPPHGGRIVAVGNHGSLQSHGTVLWHVGNLRPGASRTVHATMLVTRTGVHLNTAVASASNADPVFHGVALRARRAAARRPTVPQFTG